jgi:hypothetical protein
MVDMELNGRASGWASRNYRVLIVKSPLLVSRKPPTALFQSSPVESAKIRDTHVNVRGKLDTSHFPVGVDPHTTSSEEFLQDDVATWLPRTTRSRTSI